MLQNIFYVLGIIYMVLGIIILISILVLLIFIKKKVTEIHHEVMAKIEAITSVTARAAEIATGVGAFVADKALKARRMVKNKNDDED